MWTCRVCPVDQQIYNSTSSSDPKERDENTRNKTVDSAEGPNLRKKNKKEKRSSERKKKKRMGHMKIEQVGIVQKVVDSKYTPR